MTFDDDFAQFEFDGGTKRVRMKDIKVEWPGPELVEIHGFRMRRVQHSQISDEARAKMTHIARGALYRPDQPPTYPDGEPQ